LTGRAADAAASLESGLASLPGDPYLQQQLAVVRAAAPEASVRDGERAVELARAAYAAMPGPGPGQAVAMAYAEAGRFEEAVRAQERLLATLPSGDERRAGAEARLREYRAGRALRQPWKTDPSLLYSPVVPLQTGS
jgi:cytochrome c-type biogenesis protein CcmH/NrfG